MDLFLILLIFVLNVHFYLRIYDLMHGVTNHGDSFASVDAVLYETIDDG